MPASMWGSGIVGFGSYHYKYESGRGCDPGILERLVDAVERQYGHATPVAPRE